MWALVILIVTTTFFYLLNVGSEEGLMRVGISTLLATLVLIGMIMLVLHKCGRYYIRKHHEQGRAIKKPSE